MYKDGGDKATDSTSPPNDASSELRKGFHSSHDLTSFLKTLVDGPAGVWTARPPAQ